jgi:Acetyltransferase (GNAT) family
LSNSNPEEAATVLHDWFRSLEFDFPLDTFKQLPRHPAYKYEYFNSRAVLSPRPQSQRAVLDLRTASLPTDTPLPRRQSTIRQLHSRDWPLLPRLLATAFDDIPPFAALPVDLRHEAAEDCIEHTRSGGDGSVLESACFVAPAESNTGLLGAALVTMLEAPGDNTAPSPRPHLTWIMVNPWHARAGLAGALLACIVPALRKLGFTELLSTFLVGNTRSMMWHWRRGFRLVQPSLPRMFTLNAPTREEAR